MSDILSTDLYSVSTAVQTASWIAIRYGERGSIQEAYFGPISVSRFSAYNRMMLAIQNPISTPTPGEP